MATTRSRPRGRESARPPAGGIAAEHAAKIYGVAIVSVIGIVAFLALTSTGHVIDAATQHFMLFYAGVFTLITLCASVALGLIATDRMVLEPGHRIFVQSAHRAASFGAVAFLLTHITTEILAQRVHLLDSVVPFLSPFRTFYIGLGTIASDLILLIVITGILRKRFTAHGKAWRWRAIHYTSYVAFVFGVWHGLLGGRPGKPYVDWSYGFVVALVALGLAIRILANSLRPKETLSAPPVAESSSSGSAPMRAASMFAQLGVVRAATSATLMAQSGPQPMLSAPVDGWAAEQATGMVPTLALPVGDAAYQDAPYGYDDGRQPYYEPGYEGPPRYMGAPRHADSGPMPRATSGPMPRVPNGPRPQIASGPAPGRTGSTSGPIPRATTGPIPRATTGPIPRATTGPIPRATTGPIPRATTGPMPRPMTGPMPQAGGGPAQGRGNGQVPRTVSGPMPRATSGPMPRVPAGPMPPAGPVAGPGPSVAGPGMSVAGGGPARRPATGPVPAAERSMPRSAPGRTRRGGNGARPQAASGPMPRIAGGPMPGAPGGPMQGAAGGPMPMAGALPMMGAGTGQMPDAGSATPPGGRGAQRGGAQRGGQPGRGRAGGQGMHGQAQSAGPGWGAPGVPGAPAGSASWAGAPGPAPAPQPGGSGDWAAPQGAAEPADWGEPPVWATTTSQDWVGTPDGTGAQDWAGPQDWSEPQDWAQPQDWSETQNWAQPQDWTEQEWAGAPGWTGAAGWAEGSSGGVWSSGQPPWEGGAPVPDPAFRYREPGPGMPGYRWPGDRSRGGDEFR